MFGLIERLRNKSETYRHVVAVSTALGVTVVVFAVWMTILFPSAITGRPVVAKKDNPTEKPFNLFKQNTAQVFSVAKVHWDDFMKSMRETKYESTNEIEIVSPETGEVVSEQSKAQ